MSKEIDDLERRTIGLNTESIASILKSMNALMDLINTVDGKVDLLYEKLKLEDKKKETRGKNRFHNCIYLEDGYCMEEHHYVDPKTANVNTVKKGVFYYPQITWVNCEICDRYFFSS